MSQERTLVKAVSNRYGTFQHFRYPQAETFEDYLARRLGRRTKNGFNRTSKSVVIWTPRQFRTRILSLALYGEMIALTRKPVDEVADNPLHQALMEEVLPKN